MINRYLFLMLSVVLAINDNKSSTNGTTTAPVSETGLDTKTIVLFTVVAVFVCVLIVVMVLMGFDLLCHSWAQKHCVCRSWACCKNKYRSNQEITLETITVENSNVQDFN